MLGSGLDGYVPHREDAISTRGCDSPCTNATMDIQAKASEHLKLTGLLAKLGFKMLWKRRGVRV